MTLIELAKELSKPEYATLDNAQALAYLKVQTVQESNLIPATTVNQMFAKLDLTGSIQDIANDSASPFRHKMASVILSITGNHPFNFIQGTTAGDGNLQMLDAMIAGIPALSAKLTQFKSAMFSLSNYKPRFPSVTLDDVIKARAAQLSPADAWHPLATSNSVVNIWLKTKAPESTYIVIQHQDTLPDGSLSDWRHSTAVHGIELVGEYQAAIPTKAGRSYRWRCEYVLDCVVS